MSRRNFWFYSPTYYWWPLSNCNKKCLLYIWWIDLTTIHCLDDFSSSNIYHIFLYLNHFLGEIVMYYLVSSCIQYISFLSWADILNGYCIYKENCVNSLHPNTPLHHTLRQLFSTLTTTPYLHTYPPVQGAKIRLPPLHSMTGNSW